jgi:hypothetical protein
MQDNNEPSGVVNSESEESSSQAENGNYKPADPSRLNYLKSVALYALGIGEEIHIKGDEAIALYRVALGKGAQVELFKIQNDPGDGKGFMAMLTPRIHALRHRYGFEIENRIERDKGGNRSWYWLLLDGDGFPKMRPVPMAESKTGKPKAAKPEPVAFDERGQACMFGVQPRRPMATDFDPKTFAERIG